MATAESRPYLTPSSTSVQAFVELIEPDCDFEDAASHRTVGSSLTVGASVRLAPEFWADTAIDIDETVSVVITGTCLPSRTTWRTELRVERQADGSFGAVGTLTMDGDSLAAEVKIDVWVIGPARTAADKPDAPIHKGAKLWQLPAPISIGLDDTALGFPTSAISFSQTNRRRVLWSVESAPDAEPSWSISSGIRLYVNTDDSRCSGLIEGKASDDVYQALQSDVHIVILQTLAKWDDDLGPERISHLTEELPDSLAALGAKVAGAMGITIGEAMRLALADYSQLIARSRESLSRL